LKQYKEWFVEEWSEFVEKGNKANPSSYQDLNYVNGDNLNSISFETGRCFWGGVCCMNFRINELQTNAKKHNFGDLYSIFALKYTIIPLGGSEEDLKLNGTHQLLVYADDVNIYVYTHTHIYTIKKDVEALVVASKEIGQEVNAGKTKYLVMS
jgi:hypothetical protein